MDCVSARELLGPVVTCLRPPAHSLWIRGSFPSSPKRLAVIGTRRPSAVSLALVYQWVPEWVRAGAVIVSGLARGLDTAAHRAALRASGKTLAFLGCGLDRTYPPENRRLADEIVNGSGALLSEFAPGTAPLPYHFPLRNRLIAASCDAVVVVEAGDKSGTLSTARAAAELGREVFVVPGVPGQESFAGSFRLIEDGAHRIESAQAVLTQLGWGETPLAAKNTVHPLQPIFLERRGALSLQEIFDSSRYTLEEIAELVGSAQRQKLILECAPQTYLWLGRP